MFIDRLCGGRTAHAADYGKIPGLPLAREFADTWWKTAMEFQPGNEYDLLHQFIQDMKLESWLVIQPLKNEDRKL
jgi:hypothetical protein